MRPACHAISQRMRTARAVPIQNPHGAGKACSCAGAARSARDWSGYVKTQAGHRFLPALGWPQAWFVAAEITHARGLFLNQRPDAVGQRQELGRAFRGQIARARERHIEHGLDAARRVPITTYDPRGGQPHRLVRREHNSLSGARPDLEQLRLHEFVSARPGPRRARPSAAPADRSRVLGRD